MWQCSSGATSSSLTLAVGSRSTEAPLSLRGWAWATNEGERAAGARILSRKSGSRLLDIDVESLVRGEPSLVDETGTPQAFSIMRDAPARSPARFRRASSAREL